MHRKIGLLITLVACVNACQRELDDVHFGYNHHFVKRQAVDFPPVLSEQESVLVNSFDNNSVSDWSYYYTHGLHVGGTNRSMAQWTADRWSEAGIPSSLVQYDVYLNYPVSHSLSLTYPDGSVYTPTLSEAILPEDDTSSYPNRVPSFHGYSFTGNATAEYVYVGRGQRVDFDRLTALGIPLEGKIALAKYGGPFRGLKVKNAQEHGMIGCVIFTDPADDGNVTEANGYAAYPDGPARNPTSLQRGSVQFLSTYPGDPTTPGYPSKEGSPRADTAPVTPRIPSLPISYIEAIPLLAALDGHGVPGREVNRTRWIGALNVTYSTGPAPGAVLSMSNVMEDRTTPIWDTIGIINGTSNDEAIVIGNHRDAWIIGGAADPNSGSAIMVELGRAFGRLMQTGWRPKRTMQAYPSRDSLDNGMLTDSSVLASWDAEEYGLVGSTEFVEEYINWIVENAVAYLNIDIGTSGPRPGFAATPDLHSLAADVMKKVIFPQVGSLTDRYPQTRTLDQTLYDVWQEETQARFGVLGSGSDYTAFLHRGISSIDMGANQGPNDPVYHYHSNYDSYHWMSTFGDPGFAFHVGMGQYLALLAYHLSSDDLISFDLPNYATQMNSYYNDLLVTINSTQLQLDTTELRAALDEFESRTQEVKALESQAVTTGDTALLEVVNRKYRDFQRGFVSQGGLPTREFYKHVVFAPGIDTGYAPVTYPGITEALQAGNVTLAAEWVTRTANGILRAADIIKT